VANLGLHAGIKTARSSLFRTAVLFLDFGLSLLDNNRWTLHYNLTLCCITQRRKWLCARRTFNGQTLLLMLLPFERRLSRTSPKPLPCKHTDSTRQTPRLD
jgi:hypothetical protein